MIFKFFILSTFFVVALGQSTNNADGEFKPIIWDNFENETIFGLLYFLKRDYQ
jgi:hypothetical protein